MTSDDDELAVLADALQTRGDPHGELIGVQLAIARLPDDAHPLRRTILERRADAILERHHDALYGPLAPYVQCTARPDLRQPALVVNRWRNGFADEVTLRSTPKLAHATTYELLRRLAIAQRIRKLHSRSDDCLGVGRAVATAPLDSLRELELHDWRSNDDEGFGVDADTLAPIVNQLEALSLSAAGPLALRSRSLRRLGVLPPLASASAPLLAGCELPELAELRAYGGRIEVGLIDRLPSLHTFTVYRAAVDRGFLAQLVGSPSLARMRQLYIGESVAGDDDLELLVRHADRLAHLERIDLRGLYTPEAVAEARPRLPGCVVLY